MSVRDRIIENLTRLKTKKRKVTSFKKLCIDLGVDKSVVSSALNGLMSEGRVVYDANACGYKLGSPSFARKWLATPWRAGVSV